MHGPIYKIVIFIVIAASISDTKNEKLYTVREEHGHGSSVRIFLT
jgi:hypothetical protein